MLDANIAGQLKTYMERLAAPIELVASLDDSARAEEMRVLLEQIVATSAQITLAAPGDEARKPSFAIRRAGESARMQFAGLPMGHEFTSLVLALLQASGYPPKIDAGVIEQIRALPGDYRFETYVSLSCQNCPDVVQALNTMAAINPKISNVMIDGAAFQDEVAQRQIMAVPALYLNGEPFAQGRISIEEILAKLDTGAAAREAAKLARKEPFDLLVVGGGPAASAAAVYAARKGIRTGVVAERFGGQVLDTMAIENFISVPHTEGPQLARALEQHVREYQVDIMNLQRAEALLPAQPGGLHELRLASGAVLKARAIVLATGARWREMNVPGEQQYRGRGVAYCPHCDGPLFKGKRVAVIGGGNSGIEAAIDLAGIVAHVTVLEFMDTLRADAVLQLKLRSLPNVTVILNAQTTEVSGDGEKVKGIVYTDRASGASHRIDLEGIFVQIGLLPNTDWLKGTVELARSGEIQVDARGQTSAPGVFAAGDATTVPYKQIIIAMGEGSKASLSAFDYLIRNSLPVAAAA
ncbi:MAG: alkyl hydroperoxide reductase subunit F [Pseudomonadales bacterium]|nr:alkyl hydroperoxide reductase subunit F [Gammaproteobacteria bacterium]MBP6480952.1 alkyl hydroperoxide reductase subunit F [Pseudomonadales bacterium]MBP7908518.1 alkyl hydroperoxide reductase subunit F [Pseudomonadales bacterium]